MTDLFDQIIFTIRSQDLLEYTGLIFGILYVLLAANNKIYCWYFGIISCFAIAIKDFFSYLLYLDGLLQIFYIAMGIAGLYLWKFGRASRIERKISKWNHRRHLPYLIGILLISFVLGYFFDNYSEASFPYLDALTTLMSIYATFLLIYRVLDNWILWIFADLMYVYLYFVREAYFFSLLMVIYTIIAFVGLVKWKKLYLS